MLKHTYKIRLAAGVMTAALLFTGCNTADPSAKLVDIGGGKDSISYGYGYFFARYNQADYDQYYLQYYGDKYWHQNLMDNSKTTEESVKEETMDELKKLYFSRVHAPDFDVELTDKDNKAIQKAVKKFFKDNPEGTIKAMGATEEYLTQMLEEQTYENRVKKALLDKRDKELKDTDVNQTGFSYVNFQSGESKDKDENPISYSKKALKQMAEEVASAGDFEAAVKDTTFDLDEDNYTTSFSPKKASDETSLPEELFKQLKGLEEGEVTGVIPYEDGFVVARLDKKLDEEWTKAKRQNMQEDYYNDTMEGWEDDTPWKVNEKLWAKVKYKEAFENANAETVDESAEGDADENADGNADETTEKKGAEEGSDDKPAE